MNLLSRIQYVLGTAVRPQQEPAWLVGALAVVVSLAAVAIVGNFPGRSAAVAQEREGRQSAEEEAGSRRSAEAEAGPRRSAESAETEGGRRSPEAAAGRRRSAESESGPRRSAEGEGRREVNDALKNFKPQTQREAALYQMILQLHREVAQLRQAVRRSSADEPGRGGERDGDVPALAAGWERTKAGRVFRAYDKNGDLFVTLDEWLALTNGNVSTARRELQTKRFHEAGPGDDGKMSPAEFIGWWNHREGVHRGRRDGDRAKRGPRDGEGGRSPEAEAGSRRSAEEDRPRRSPEAEPRRSAEGDSGANRPSPERE